MAREMKVYSGTPDGRTRHIVAATTKKAAIELLNQAGFRISRNHFNDYWSATGNEQQIEAGLDNPGCVLIESGGNYSNKFTRLPARK